MNRSIMALLISVTAFVSLAIFIGWRISSSDSTLGKWSNGSYSMILRRAGDGVMDRGYGIEQFKWAHFDDGTIAFRYPSDRPDVAYEGKYSLSPDNSQILINGPYDKLGSHIGVWTRVR